MAEERDFTELSDDEVMNLDAADFERMAAAAESAANETNEEEEQEESEEARQAREQAAAQEEEGNSSSDEEVDDNEEDGEQESEDDDLTDEEVEARLAAGDDGTKPAKEKAEPAAKADKNKSDAKTDDFDAEDAKKLFGTFKANGRNMSIRSADEGIRLMQLGAGYNAKMEELKPKLALMRTLEREGLLDSDKLGFLIDLHKKNPEAIGKLVKDSGVDVLDLDADKIAAYKSSTRMTSVKEVELDEVLDGLKDTTSYNKLMDVVAHKWDPASKAEVGNNPAVLQVISNHMEAGYYDLILDEFERKKALGEIASGTPFLAAYAKIGDDLNAKGAFGTPEAAPAKKVVTPGKEKARATLEAENRRKAAAPTRKSGTPVPRKPVVDVWNMSDTDFQKLQQPR